MVAGMDRKTRQWLELGATAVASAALTAFARNFISGEKKIKHRIHHPHEVGHPQRVVEAVPAGPLAERLAEAEGHVVAEDRQRRP